MCFDILMLINDLCVAFLQGLIEKRIRPWVNKKIAEYIGEPEPTLTDFICSKVGSGYFYGRLLVGFVKYQQSRK